MIIEIQQEGIKIGKEQLFRVLVDGEVAYSNLNYDELCEITIGDLDKEVSND